MSQYAVDNPPTSTPTETYHSFCTECATLETRIAALKTVPALETLDELEAAERRLAKVQALLGELGREKERYEREQQLAARLAVQAPRWATAAAAKGTALGEVSARLNALFSAIDAYIAAHGTQMSVLLALNYSREFRVQFSKAPFSLQQIVMTMAQGDRSWLAKVPTFDTDGIVATLPCE